MKKIILLSTVFGLLIATACKKEGCTDKTAINYDSKATKDNNTCTYEPAPVDIRDPYVNKQYTIIDSVFNNSGTFQHVVQRLDGFNKSSNSDQVESYNKIGDLNATSGAGPSGSKYFFKLQANGSFVFPAQTLAGNVNQIFINQIFTGSGAFGGDLITYTITSSGTNGYKIKGSGTK